MCHLDTKYHFKELFKVIDFSKINTVYCQVTKLKRLTIVTKIKADPFSLKLFVGVNVKTKTPPSTSSS